MATERDRTRLHDCRGDPSAVSLEAEAAHAHRWRISTCWARARAARAAQAAPYRPASDDTVLERLPAARSPHARELAAERRALARRVAQTSARARARVARDRAARRERRPALAGPRQKAALAPWLARPSRPPRRCCCTRRCTRTATISQAREADLAARARARPAQRTGLAHARHDRAGARRAGALAQRSCRAASARRRARPRHLPRGCRAASRARGAGSAGGSRARSSARWARPRRAPVWALAALAEIAARLGDRRGAEANFRAALALAPRDPYAAARARGPPARCGPRRGRCSRCSRTNAAPTACSCASRSPSARSARPASPPRVRELRARFAASRAARRAPARAARRRASRSRSERGDAARGARSSRAANFAAQREPRDARVLLEAALAAGDAGRGARRSRWLAHRARGRPPRAAREAWRRCGEARARLAARARGALRAGGGARAQGERRLPRGLRTAPGSARTACDVALRDLDLALGLDADGDGRSPGASCARGAPRSRPTCSRTSRISADGKACPRPRRPVCASPPTATAPTRRCRSRATARPLRPLALEYDLLFDARRAAPRPPALRTRRRRRHGRALARDARRNRARRAGRTRALRRLRARGRAPHRLGTDHVLFLLCCCCPRSCVGRVAARGARRACARLAPRCCASSRAFTLVALAHALAGRARLRRGCRRAGRVRDRAVGRAVRALQPLAVSSGGSAPRSRSASASSTASASRARSAISGCRATRARSRCSASTSASSSASSRSSAAFLPLAFALRGSALGSRFALAGGSLAITAVASVWLWERALGV